MCRWMVLVVALELVVATCCEAHLAEEEILGSAAGRVCTLRAVFPGLHSDVFSLRSKVPMSLPTSPGRG